MSKSVFPTPKLLASTCAGVGLMIAMPTLAATAERTPFGMIPDGAILVNTAIEAVTLRGADGVSARIMTLGATLQALNAPDRQGHVADVTIGHDNAADYVTAPNYWGQTIGRYANRIAGGRFTIAGRSYQLTQNDKANSLHGGTHGWDKAVWRITSIDQGGKGKPAAVRLELISPAGDEGYPGTVQATVTYSLDDHGSLTIDYDATTDATTIINLTNHALFALGGEGSANGLVGQRLTIPASRYTPVDAALIPTGEMAPVAGTVFDFRHGRVILDGLRDGRDPQIRLGQGYDHNFVLDAGQTATPKLSARLEDPASGRVLEVLSTEPGLQFYSGNFLVGTLLGKNHHLYRMGDGLALEPQRFPDTPNRPAFGSALLEPGKPYHHRMIYRLSIAR